MKRFTERMSSTRPFKITILHKIPQLPLSNLSENSQETGNKPEIYAEKL